MRSHPLGTWVLTTTLLLGGRAIGAKPPAASQEGGVNEGQWAQPLEKSVTIYPQPSVGQAAARLRVVGLRLRQKHRGVEQWNGYKPLPGCSGR